jgi:hypothetical protein
MRVVLLSRRDALSLSSLALATLPVLRPFPALADSGVTALDAQRYEPPPDALGGLATGTGRSLNALIKFRAETGIERTGAVEDPLFKPGQILDELKTVSGGAAEVAFAFPEQWTMAGGPNLDVRDIKTSDSAFVLAAPLPAKATFDTLKDEWFLKIIFAPEGKYGQYGAVEDRKVVSSKLVDLTLPRGGTQPYRMMSLKFAPLTYNQNTVERRALVSATEVGGTVFMLLSGSFATRFKTMQPDLAAVQQSFRVVGRRGSA